MDCDEALCLNDLKAGEEGVEHGVFHEHLQSARNETEIPEQAACDEG